MFRTAGASRLLPGLMHLGMGLVCGSKIKDLVDAGFDVTIFLADWHSWINGKFGGDMEKIRFCGEYFKDCFASLGLTEGKVHYRWASDLVGDRDYWEKVITIAKSASLPRILRALPILGRRMDEKEVETAHLIYPCMQAADISHMNIDVACAGMDQRKAHVLARETADKLKKQKPICLHTPLLMGLQARPSKTADAFDEDAKLSRTIAMKMSKSIPDSAIFIHDSPSEIDRKIRKAFCPEKDTENNPVLDYFEKIIFPRLEKVEVVRPASKGGPVTYESFRRLAEDYRKGLVHPLDLKTSSGKYIADILVPSRTYFAKRQDILDRMQSLDKKVS